MLMDSILFPPLKVKYNYYAIVAKIAVFYAGMAQAVIKMA
jgi:hypothetical protein